jgi:cytosine/creatinine deaminase
MDHELFMKEAIEEAKKGYSEGGIPIGAVLIKDGEIVGRGHNRRVQKKSTVLHAEMDCLENAGRHPGIWYKDTVIYSTLSPCPMCTGAIILYGIPTIVIGENETFKGPEEYSQSQGVEIINLDNKECKYLMKTFIGEKPDLWNEDIGL